MANESEIDPRYYQTAPVNTKSPDHKTIYSNVIRTTVSPYDIRIIFGQVADNIPGNFATQTEDLASVIVAPEGAKALITVLQQAINRYEQMYGGIRDTTSTLNKMKEDALAKVAVQGGASPAPKAGTPRKPKKH
jgi:hypothetical protein